MNIGYARVSTDDQRLDLQIDALIAAGVDPGMIYREHVSGVKTNRPELAECLRALRGEDTLVVWRLDRLGRSLVELVRITEDLNARGIHLRSLNEQIDTTTAGGKLIFAIFAAMAQFERDLISERTKAGLKAARARGHRGGRPPILDAADIRIAMAALDADPCITTDEIAARFKVSRSTLDRALRRAQDPERLRELTALADRRHKTGHRRRVTVH